jgi:hypothetical protein
MEAVGISGLFLGQAVYFHSLDFLSSDVDKESTSELFQRVEEQSRDTGVYTNNSK